MSKKLRYWRCPVCSKLSFPKNFVEGAEGYPIEIAIQKTLSKPKHMGGFKWEFYPMSQEELVSLKTILKTVSGRLDDLIDVEEELNSVVSEEDFWKKADAYMVEVEQFQESIKGEIEYRKRLIAKLAKKW